MNIEINIDLYETPWDGSPTLPPSVHGEVTRKLDATNLDDNEENAVRLGEQMIRTAFRKWRDKTK